MKTISELNSKWWYRLLKVVFFLSLIPWLIFSFSLGYYLNSSDKLSTDPYILCSDGTKMQPKISQYDKNDVLTVTPKEDLEYTTFCSNFVKEGNDSKNYTYHEGVVPTNWFAVITFSFLFIIGFLIALETVRRIFYYIVFGTIKPKK